MAASAVTGAMNHHLRSSLEYICDTQKGKLKEAGGSNADRLRRAASYCSTARIFW
jgi:hypothetical protein